MRSNSFAAAKRPVKTKENVIQPARHDHDASACRLSQSSLIEAADARRYFSEVVKRDQIEWAIQFTQIFSLDHEVIAIAKTVIFKATQRDVAANV